MLTSRLLILNQKEAECKEMAAYFQDSGYSVIWCTEYDRRQKFFPGERTNQIY